MSSQTGSVVLKFGGTSVTDADAMRRVVEITARERGCNPVVITSACAGVTDQLLDCAGLCRIGSIDAARGIVREIHRRHHAILDDLIGGDPHCWARSQLGALLDELSRLVEGVALLGELTPRTVDAFASFGERLSSALLVEAFARAGWRAHLGDSRRCIRTDDQHCNARPVIEQIERLAPCELLDPFEKCDVVVAQGFIGSTPEGICTTIGRGGSDHTAALVGAALGSREIQIWTDVSGILTADPRIVPDARVVAAVSFSEARELASFGAKVIHPDTILPAVRRAIPVVIRNSRSADDPGTRILADDAPLSPGLHSITMTRAVSIVHLSSDEDALAGALATFEAYGVPIRCAVVADRQASAVIESNRLEGMLLAALSTRVAVDVEHGQALIAMVGSGLRGASAVLAGPLSALRSIAVPFVAAGGSDHSVLLTVGEDAAEDVIRTLHAAVFA